MIEIMIRGKKYHEIPDGLSLEDISIKVDGIRLSSLACIVFLTTKDKDYIKGGYING